MAMSCLDFVGTTGTAGGGEEELAEGRGGVEEEVEEEGGVEGGVEADDEDDEDYHGGVSAGNGNSNLRQRRN